MVGRCLVEVAVEVVGERLGGTRTEPFQEVAYVARTIVEALALVTWWGAVRVVGRRPASREVEAGVGTPRQPML